MPSRRNLLFTMPLAAATLASIPRSIQSLGGPSRLAADSLRLPGALRIAPDHSSVEVVAKAIRSFSADLYRALARTGPPASNVVCSPYSVAAALAMARVGARGVTASEMDAVLHAPDLQALNTGFNALDQLMVSRYRDHSEAANKRPRLAVANSLWPRSGLALEPAFVETLASYYGADVHTVDFARATEAARREINAWVSDHTAGKIPELIKAGMLGPQTLLVLANALYLSASWDRPFDEKATTTARFTCEDGRQVSVPMMNAAPQVLGFQDAGAWVAVEVPYVGSDLAMAIVVPAKNDLRTLESAIDGPWLTKLLTGFRPQPIRLSLPRWTFRLPCDLRELLASLGMPTAFSAKADFSGITRETALCIDKVVHETFVTVNEKGTEAAAATAVIIKENGVPSPTPLVVDQSFLYIIHDVATATPLFIGRVGNPVISAV